MNKREIINTTEEAGPYLTKRKIVPQGHAFHEKNRNSRKQLEPKEKSARVR